MDVQHLSQAPQNFGGARRYKTGWRPGEFTGETECLDLSKPFLPESLARVRGLFFLSDREQRLLNQIRGCNYLYIFGLAEELILPFMKQQADARLEAGDGEAIRPLAQVALKNPKHIGLFKRFRGDFAAQTGVDCEVIGPAEDMAAEILRHDPLAAALAIFGAGLVAQSHFIDDIRDDASLNPHFKNLLKQRWIEVMQHAPRDFMIVHSLSEGRDENALDTAVADYLHICSFLDHKLKQQTVFDLATFERTAGRALNGEDRADFLRIQHQAMRWTFIGSELRHPQMKALIESLTPDGARLMEKTSLSFC